MLHDGQLWLVSAASDSPGQHHGRHGSSSSTTFSTSSRTGRRSLGSRRGDTVSARDVFDGLFVFFGTLAIIGTCVVIVLLVNSTK